MLYILNTTREVYMYVRVCIYIFNCISQIDSINNTGVMINFSVPLTNLTRNSNMTPL